MLAEWGQVALAVAAVVAGLQAVLGLAGAERGWSAWMTAARRAAVAQAVLLGIAFGLLVVLFLKSDFSVRLVASHSTTVTPWYYRMTASWGNHEGSMLLWATALAGWGAAVAGGSSSLTATMRARVVGILGLVSVGFLLFLMLTSNPFERLVPPPAEGRDLNPLLQDPGMILHPPLLYMGYVGTAVAFAFAIAALLTGRLDAAWSRWARPWALTAWVFLTLGIVVGSWWAYYELGWGGWWFWDPVENAALIPWLVMTAFLHSVIVTEKRDAFRAWTVLLAIAAFALSLLGTFLVRSGVITSVHAFATDPTRGLFILGLLAITVGASLALFAWRAPTLSGGGGFNWGAREATLLVNNVLLSVAAASVLLGTVYPLLVEALGGGKLSVGEPYYVAVFVPLMAPAVLLMGIAPFLRWKGDDWRRVGKTIGVDLLVAAGGALAIVGGWGNGSWRAWLGLSLALWVFASSGRLLWRRLVGERREREEKGRSVRVRWRETPAGWWGMWLAHLGVGVFIVGVTVLGALERRLDVKMVPGGSTMLADYRFVFQGVEEVAGPNYKAQRATIEVWQGDRQVAQLRPEKRDYYFSTMPMTEAAIDSTLWRDLYVSLGEPLEGGAWVVVLFYKPMVFFIWLGPLLMAVGGVLAALDRRYRLMGSRGERSKMGIS
ncbi:MAG: heme lyase CcmF/NrfE family subunit [Hydrogenophilus sp.]|nr:heme lyase CcmF/NrfE family subunit [Hydrogenophilus sp.]